ncbi:MAG: hypothetical protein MHM6MM_006263 [Cercozoa sp. M6MM]
MLSAASQRVQDSLLRVEAAVNGLITSQKHHGGSTTPLRPTREIKSGLNAEQSCCERVTKTNYAALNSRVSALFRRRRKARAVDMKFLLKQYCGTRLGRDEFKNYVEARFSALRRQHPARITVREKNHLECTACDASFRSFQELNDHKELSCERSWREYQSELRQRILASRTL